MKLYEDIKISVAKYRFLLRAREELNLPPFKGSTFRGAFGNVFKSLICIQRHYNCDSCFIKNRCIYTYIFETPLDGDSVKVQGETVHSTHPFIIEPPENTERIIPAGAKMYLNLILIGAGIEYLPYFIYTFRKMGLRGIGKGRGKYDLLQVERITLLNEPEVIYSDEDQLLSTEPEPIHFKDFVKQSQHNQDTEIHFITPTRLIDKGHFSRKVPFELLMRALFRRINQLNVHHCGAAESIDFRPLLINASRVKTADYDLHVWDWERYSSRQKQYIRMNGIIGKAIYQNVPPEFIPFLQLAEYIHVGKYAVFGMGRVRIK